MCGLQIRKLALDSAHTHTQTRQRAIVTEYRVTNAREKTNEPPSIHLYILYTHQCGDVLCVKKEKTLLRLACSQCSVQLLSWSRCFGGLGGTCLFIRLADRSKVYARGAVSSLFGRRGTMRYPVYDTHCAIGGSRPTSNQPGNKRLSRSTIEPLHPQSGPLCAHRFGSIELLARVRTHQSRYKRLRTEYNRCRLGCRCAAAAAVAVMRFCSLPDRARLLINPLRQKRDEWKGDARV